MNSRTDALFLEALQIPEGTERDAFLDEACKDDAELRGRLDVMLADDSAADAFFDGPDTVATPSVRSPLSGEMPGDVIGRFKLVQIIGEGGFGTVWMAEQSEPVQRQVALKIIRMGMDTRDFIARFEQEQQALAMMDHPNIARVLDGGATPAGRPYFVMELVHGVPITKFCDEHKLPLAARLALFMEVCHAINHAHQKGVIHRDIKPSNVMVTLDGDKAVPKVIDFGIAKATQGKLTDETIVTRLEQFVGTPVYMSPEQAAMIVDIDTRCDIYALGILLYELLTGKPPFDAKSLASAGYEEMRRIIREVEPPKPSSKLSDLAGDERTTLAEARHIEPGKLSRMVEPDLDWIVMKAIEKDRTRRYETVNGLALDIQRFLANEPVSAGPPTARYRFRKFARRNKTALRVAAGIVTLLVAATIVSLWQALRATRAEKLANDRLGEKELALKDAEDISTFLGEVFESPDPSRDGRLIKVAALLDKAAKKLETELASQPVRRAKLQGALGRSYHALGLYGEAIPIQEKVRDYFLADFGLEHPNTLGAMLYLANSYDTALRGDEALRMREQVFTLFRKINGLEHSETLSAMHNLAISYHNTGRQEEARQMREEVLTLRRKVNGPEHPDTLKAIGSLAGSYNAAGRKEEAIKLHEEEVLLCRKVLGKEQPGTLKAMNNLAKSYTEAGRRDEALKLAEEMLPICRKVLGPEHPDTLVTMTNVANDYHNSGQWEKAIKLGEEVLPLLRRINGLEHPETLRAIGNLASDYHDDGRKEEALKLREEELLLIRKVNGLEDPETLGAMTNLAISYGEAGRLAEAIELQGESLATMRRVLPPNHRYLVVALGHMAWLYGKTGRKDDASTLREEAIALSREVNGPESPATLSEMQDLAIFYSHNGRTDEAIKLAEEVLTLRRKVLGPEHPETLETLTNLAIFYGDAGLQDKALKMREEVLTLRPGVNGPEHPETLGAMTNLAISYAAAGRLADAIKMQEHSLAIKRRVLRPNHPYLANALRHMAQLYEKDGRKAEAEALRKELADKGNPSPPSSAPAPTPAPAPEPKTTPEPKPRANMPAISHTLVAPDAEWKWLHPTDGNDPAETTKGFHATFFLSDFDDSAWKTGKDSDAPDAGFGYGLNFKGVTIGKPDDVRHRKTAWFRHRFVTDKQHGNLELRCQRDDGIIVYLDGKEVIRDNVAPGADSWLLPSLTAMDRENDNVVYRHAISGPIAAGPHILAISVHNTAQPSSDLRLGGVTLVEVEAPKK